jgi:UDP-glucose 4-epimerase
MGTKVLLTGGAGFIGSHLAEAILEKSYNLKIIDNFSTGNINNIKSILSDVELIEGDIRNISTISKVMKDIDIVVHQAALPSIQRSINDPITTNEVNVIGTLNLLWAAVKNKVDKFLFASSSSVYGNNSNDTKHESDPPSPLSPYAASKLAGENYCRVFSNVYGIQTVCLRYFNVFGSRQDPNSQYSAVIPKLINFLIKDKNPVIYGDGSQSRDFTYITNVINANLLAIENSTEKHLVLNCACNKSIALNQVIKELNEILGKKIEPLFESERAGEVKHSCADISLAKQKINYSPEIFFSEGLKKTVKDFINNT